MEMYFKTSNRILTLKVISEETVLMTIVSNVGEAFSILLNHFDVIKMVECALKATTLQKVNSMNRHVISKQQESLSLLYKPDTERLGLSITIDTKNVEGERMLKNECVLLAADKQRVLLDALLDWIYDGNINS